MLQPKRFWIYIPWIVRVSPGLYYHPLCGKKDILHRVWELPRTPPLPYPRGRVVRISRGGCVQAFYSTKNFQILPRVYRGLHIKKLFSLKIGAPHSEFLTMSDFLVFWSAPKNAVVDQFGNAHKYFNFSSKYWHWYLRTSRQIDGLVVGQTGAMNIDHHNFLCRRFKNLPPFWRSLLTFFNANLWQRRWQSTTGLKQLNLPKNCL